jgi:hypothetical protein
VTEHAPLPYQDAEPTPEREPEAVAHPAQPEPVSVYAAAFGGEGERYTFAEHHTTLELYPAGTIFTYTAAESTITVQVSTTGEVVFTRAPLPSPEATELPTTAGDDPSRGNSPPSPEPAVSAPSTASQEHPRQQSSKRGDKEQEEQKKVVVVGNVATEPTFKETRKGQMAKFSLAEHPDVETTIYHSVVAFGQRAEKLKDNLSLGEEVKVVGKPIEWQPQPKKGKPAKPEKAILLWQLSRVEKKSR